MAPARYYDESKNTNGSLFPGVPLRDIEQTEWDEFPDWLQRSVDESPLYRKTKPAASATLAHDKKDGE